MPPGRREFLNVVGAGIAAGTLTSLRRVRAGAVSKIEAESGNILAAYSV